MLRNDIKNIIKESITPIIYHFSKINKVINILENNNFILRLALEGNKPINKNKFFFLSTTRIKNSNIGFPATMAKYDSLVRLELNGQKLNNNYKSIPVSYWNPSRDINDPEYKHYTNNKYSKEFYQNFNKHDENEDRIIHDKKYIPNANKYITKIDVFVNEVDINNQELQYLKFLADQLNIPIYFYDDLKYFDHQTTKYSFQVQPNNIPVKKDYNEEFPIYQLARLFAVLKMHNPNILSNYKGFNKTNSQKIKKELDNGFSISYDLSYKRHNDYLMSTIINDITHYIMQIENAIPKQSKDNQKQLLHFMNYFTSLMKSYGTTHINEFIKKLAFKNKLTKPKLSYLFKKFFNKKSKQIKSFKNLTPDIYNYVYLYNKKLIDSEYDKILNDIYNYLNKHNFNPLSNEYSFITYHFEDQLNVLKNNFILNINENPEFNDFEPQYDVESFFIEPLKKFLHNINKTILYLKDKYYEN